MLPKIILLANVFLGVTAQYFLKLGVTKTTIPFSLINIPKLLFQPYVFFGFFLYGISSIIWIYILKNLPLSIAYPALSLGYILVLFISWKFLGENIGPLNILGVTLIVAGVSLLFIKY
jgi:drug/metabolite transporter (DMT)-like permease